MFVSANAARGLLNAAPGLCAAFGPGLRAWSPGPGTAQLLVRLGLPREAIAQPMAGASQFDSESLWQQVAPQVRPGFRVLIVRGADESGQAAGRDWLMRQVRAAGGEVADVAAYARVRPAGLAERLRALDAPDGRHGWLFSSSHAVAQLRALAASGEWMHDWSRDVALCTHGRIAEAASALGLGQVRVCRPAFDEVRASIESFA
jgi:uroporphyrinogen-III synthase